MAEKKPATKGAKKPATGFTTAEKAAMRERAKEMRARTDKEGGEADVLAKIAEMGASDRAIAERFHALVHANTPDLVPRTWYGMPAYARDGQIVFHFKPAEKFGERYASIGFSDEANLDEGHMWATSYAITQLTPSDEAKIAALLKQAVR